MKKITRRMFAFVLAIAMVVGMMPTTTFAGEEDVESSLIIESVTRIKYGELFKDRTDIVELDKMKSNQNQVTDAKYSDGIITVNANIKNMQKVESTAEGAGTHKFFAIMVNFEDVGVLETDGVFSSVDVEDAYQCGGTEGKSAILWINGDDREGKGSVVTDITLNHTNGTDKIDIKLVVNDISSPAIRDVSKIEAEDMFKDRKDTEFGSGYEAKVKQMQANQEFVESVEYNALKKEIVVNANISRMEAVESTTIGGDAQKYFAIMVDFYDVDILETGNDKVFAQCDVTDAKDCAKEGQSTTDSAILWINGSNEDKNRTMTLKTKGATNDVVAQYSLIINEIDEAVEVTGASKITEGSEAIRINQEYIELVKWESSTNTITVNADMSKMKTSTSTTDNSQPADNKYFAIMVEFKDIDLLKTGNVFAPCDIEAAKEIGKDNSAILWINGTTKELCSGVEGDTNYKAENNKSLELESKDGDVKSTIKLVVNETGKEVKVKGAYDIDKDDLFAKRTDEHAEAMRANQKYVENVDFNLETKTITVNADISEMEPIVSSTISGEPQKYFAIMVDFEDIGILKVGEEEPFAPCDKEAANECKTDYQDVTNSAVLWINGSTRTDNVNTTNLNLVSTDDGKTYTYKLVVKEVTYPVEITGASKIEAEDMFPERNDDHAVNMRYNQEYVNSVEFNQEENVINVEVDVNGVKDIESPSAGTKKWFAIMVNFKDVSVLQTGDGMIFETVDITDAGKCKGGNNSAILWISATSGTRDIPLTLINKNTQDTANYTLKLVSHEHIMNTIEENPATCTAEGRKEYYQCQKSNCGRMYSDETGLNETTLEDLKIDKLHDHLEVVDAKEATCIVNGNKKHYKCNSCNKLYEDSLGTTEIQEEDVLILAQHGTLTRVPALEPTCLNQGNVEYYTCDKCEDYIVKQGDKYIVVTEEKIFIPAFKHDIKEMAAKEPTCTHEGNYKHYKCTRCNEMFSDPDGQHKEIEDEVVIEKLSHKISPVAAVSATCTKQGTKSHYKCSACGTLFTDAAGKTTTTKAALAIAAHNRTKVARKAATYSSTGIKEHYKCSCGKLYSDVAGSKEITSASIVLPKLTLGTTTKVDIGNLKKDSVKIAWYKVPGATGYRVFVKKSGKWVTLKTLSGTSYTATKLAAGTKYTFAVRAYVKESGKVIWASKYVTKSGYTRPSKTKITVTSRAKTSINLSWSKVKGATGYRVYVKQNGKWKTLKTTTGRKYTVKKLNRRRNYTFAVKAYTKVGNTVIWSDVYTTKTAKTR